MFNRKEPILFVLALLFGAWVVLGSETEVPDERVRAGTADFEPTRTTSVLLADARARVAVADRDAFVEPSEAVSLPPRDLTLPALGPLAFVRPPAVPGQLPAAWYQLRVEAREVPTGVTLTEPELESAAGSAAGTVRDPVDAEPGDDRDPAKAAEFDWVRSSDGNELWGRIVEPEGDELFRMVAEKRYNRVVRFEWLNVKPESSNYGKPVRRDPLVFDPGDASQPQVLGLRLARTLDNEIGLRRVQIPDGVDSVPQRIEFIQWLLERGRSETSAFTEAEEQAKKVVEYLNGDEEGYVWLVRVLRAQGRIDAEWDLYAEVGNGTPPGWVRRGRGEILARLTLWEDAEANLAAAVDDDPENPRSRASYAAFLLDQGRIDEALAQSEEAFRLRTRNAEIAPELVALHIRVLLAAGRLAEAESALQTLDAVVAEDTTGIVALMRGAVAHAAGRTGDAQAAFAEAAGSPSGSAGAVGVGLAGAAGAASGWQEAYEALGRASVDVPVHRGTALAGQAALRLRAGDLDGAEAKAGEALQVDPTDPYAHYVLVRSRRLAGDAVGAADAALEALRLYGRSADLVAELTRALLDQHAATGDATALRRALRYATRLCELDRRDDGTVRTTRFLELRALSAYRLEDFATARQVFEEAKDRSYFARLGLAVIAYRQRRVDEARELLQGLSRDAGLPAEVRNEAGRLLDDIDDHAEKEQMRDAFARSDLGGRWGDQSMGRVFVRLDDEKLRIEGALGNDGFAYARRTTPEASKFLSAEVTFELGRDDTSDFAGLRLALDGRGTRNFSARLGIQSTATRGRQAVVKLPNPKRGEDEEFVTEEISDRIAGFDPLAEHRLEFEVIEPVDGKKGTYGLRALWNGSVVFETEQLQSGGLSSTSRGVLGVDLLVEGRPGARVEATFDDFRLVRRRQN